jgi:hypothetical protein
MREITNVLNKYRECSRNLWNTHFLSNPSPSIPDMRERFDEIDKYIFSALVLVPLGKEELEGIGDREPLLPIKIVPIGDGSVPIMINRPSSDRNKYWDDPVNQAKASEIDLRFIGYFDWNQYGYADFRYYLTRIVSFQKYPHLVGRDALIETIHAHAFLIDS